MKKQLLKYAPDIEECLIGVETVSSSIIWNKNPNEDGDILPKRDYRYNIDKIIDLLINNIQLKAIFKVFELFNISIFIYIFLFFIFYFFYFIFIFIFFFFYFFFFFFFFFFIIIIDY